MRRKSTRNTVKHQSPEKTTKDEKKKTRRATRRNKPSSSESDSDDEPLIRTKVQLKADIDSNSDDSNARSRTSRRTRNKSVSDDDKTTTRRTRRRAISPTIEEDDDEDEKGKGKSKGKNKSKLDQSSHVCETEMQSEISENVQVTAQSPHNVANIDDVDKRHSDCDNADDAETRNSEIVQPAVSESQDSDGNVQNEVDVANNEASESANDITEEQPNCETETIKSEIVLNQNNVDSAAISEVTVDGECKNPIEEINNATSMEDSTSNEAVVEKTMEDSTSNEAVVEKTSAEEVISINDEAVEPLKVIESKDSSDEEVTNLSIKSDTENQEAPKKDEVIAESSIEETTKPSADPEDDNDTSNLKSANDEVPSKDEEIAEESSAVNDEFVNEEAPLKDKEIPEENSVVNNEVIQKTEDSLSNEVPNDAASSNETTKENVECPIEEITMPAEIKSSISDEEETKVIQRQSLSDSLKLSDTLKLNATSELEIRISELPEMKEPPKPLKRLKLANKKLAKRIRKWGKTAYCLDNDILEISTDKLIGFYPQLNLIDENEVKLDFPKERRVTTEQEVARKVSVDEKSSADEAPEEEKRDVDNIIAMNRKISIVDDDASKLKPPPSPAKNDKSEILFITNLVRPFTIKQLKELLERTGAIKADGFWTDRIKSKCYVHYESAEEAEATRNALHGVHWPIGNGKKLIIEFATSEDLEVARNPPPPPVVVVPVKPEVPEKENQEPEQPAAKKRSRKESELETEWERKIVSSQENWESNKRKEDLHIRRSRSKERNDKRRRSRSRHSRSHSHETKRKLKKVEEIPQRAMDDLFRKTEATPCIYWQPLSPDEISLKQQQRLERMAEHKRRMETQTRVKRTNEHPRGGGGGGGGPPYRRRY